MKSVPFSFRCVGKPYRLPPLALFTLALFGTAMSSPAQKAPTITQVEFRQLDWYDAAGVLTTPNSLWGELRFTYVPNAVTSYLNLSVGDSQGASPIWVVQNLPLFPVDTDDSGQRSESAYIDLALAGLSEGDDWTGTWWQLTIDAYVQPNGPGNLTMFSSVQSEEMYSSGEGPPVPGVGGPGSPAGIMNDQNQTKCNTQRKIPSVQEDKHKCFVGATARSIGWLLSEHDVSESNTKTGQEAYEGLCKAGVGVRDPSVPRNLGRWIELKNAYARACSNNKIVTKVWDPGDLGFPNLPDGMVPPIQGVEEMGGDFMEWLKKEIKKGEDIEIGLFGGGVDMCITFVQLSMSGGKTHIKYRNDTNQCDDMKGDSGTKTGELKKDANGDYTIHDMKIYFALSESVEQPDTGDVCIPEVSVGNSRSQGVETAFNSIWVSTAGPPTIGAVPEILKYDILSGQILESYAQSTTSSLGHRDGAADESNFALYFGDENGQVVEYTFDPLSGDIHHTATHSVLLANVTISALCIDPASGHFYAKDGTGPIYEFDLGGTMFQTLTNPNVDARGLAWDELNQTIWASEPGGVLTEIDPTTGQSTGRTIQNAGGQDYVGADAFVDFRNKDRLTIATVQSGLPSQIDFFNLAVTPNTNVVPALLVDPLVAGSGSLLEVFFATPNSPVIPYYSLAGGGPFTVSSGILRLTPPLQQLPTLTTNLDGFVDLNLNVPAQASGIDVWMQVLDPAANLLSNGIYHQVQ